MGWLPHRPKPAAKGHAALFGSKASSKKPAAAAAAPKKRRVVEDEEDDDDDEDDADGSSCGVEPPADEGEPEPEEEAAPKPAPEPTKKGMKLVDKTYVDKDGYFCAFAARTRL